MLSVLHPGQDPASDLFTALVMAAASAANGRDALAASLPSHQLLAVRGHEQPCAGESPEWVAEMVAGLSHLVAGRLTQVAFTAPDTGHRRPGRVRPRGPNCRGYLRAAHQQAMTGRARQPCSHRRLAPGRLPGRGTRQRAEPELEMEAG